MSDKCNHPEIGKYLHAFELGILPEEKRTAFEEHLLNCSYCFNEVEAMHRPLEIMESSIDLYQIATSAKINQVRKNTLIQNLSDWIKFGWGKPAILVIVILLSAYPAYLGLSGKKQSNHITTIQSLSLFTHRGNNDAPFEFNNNQDLVLSIICPDIDRSKQYKITITTGDRLELITIPNFDGFDQYNTGHIKIPKELLTTSDYSVEVISPETDTLYHFTFRLQTQE